MAAAKKADRRLAYTVHVPVIEKTDDGVEYVARHEVFEAGSTLPKWAADVCGDHVYEPEDNADEAGSDGDES